MEGRTLVDRQALETGKGALVLLEPAHQQAVDVAGLRNSGAVLDAFGKTVAIEHRDAIEEIAQHAAGEQARKASANYDCMRDGHARVPGRMLARGGDSDHICVDLFLDKSFA